MSALVSGCGRYRYSLEREVSMLGTGTVVFIGVNPSTADAEFDDATIRKMSGFVDRWGYARFVVGNVFAWRATDVRDLPADRATAVGDMNYQHLLQMLSGADLVVPCWGNVSKVPPSHRAQFGMVRALLSVMSKPVMCFGLTNSGSPKHPLMLGYDTNLIPYRK